MMRQGKLNRASLYLGILLLAAFLGQDAFDLRWQWLQQRQSDAIYQQVSGLALALYLAGQWYLSFLRVRGKRRRAKYHYKAHIYMGALAPLLFYFHSIKIGHAYIAFLSLVYFSNFAVGLSNPVTLNVRQKSFIYYWMIVHVTLSVLVVILTAYHLSIALYYE